MPINKRALIVIDIETGSKNPHSCEPLQLCAQVIHSRSLEMIPDGIFRSYMKPLDFNNLEQEALDINHITVEMLQDAPEQKHVWLDFANFVKKYNPGTGTFTAPIMCGYNIDSFDSIIINRLAKQYGQWDSERETNNLFNQMIKYDLLQTAWEFFENTDKPENLKLTTLCEMVGLDTTHAHDAMIDVENTSKLLILFMRRIRLASQKTRWYANARNNF